MLANIIFDDNDFDYYLNKVHETITQNKQEGTIKNQLPTIQKVIGDRLRQIKPTKYKPVSLQWFTDPEEKEWSPTEAAFILFGIEPMAKGTIKPFDDFPDCIKMLSWMIHADYFGGAMEAAINPRVEKPPMRAVDALLFASTEGELILSPLEFNSMLLGLMKGRQSSVDYFKTGASQNSEEGNKISCVVNKMNDVARSHTWHISYAEKGTVINYGKNAGFGFFWLLECFGRPNVTIPLSQLYSFVPAGLRAKADPETPEINPLTLHETFLASAMNDNSDIPQVTGFSIQYAFPEYDLHDRRTLREVSAQVKAWINMRAGTVSTIKELKQKEPRDHQAIEKCNQRLGNFDKLLKDIEKDFFINNGRVIPKQKKMGSYDGTAKEDGTPRTSRSGEQAQPNKDRDKFSKHIETARERLEKDKLVELSEFIKQNVRVRVDGITYTQPDDMDNWNTELGYEEIELSIVSPRAS